MHICVIGSGIAGLSAAHRLLTRPGTAVTVVEASAELGGRARVTAGGEHCTRFFMEDFRSVLGLLREIPSGEGAGTVADAIRPVRRFAWVPAGRWVEITHTYAARARELSLRERWASARAGGTALLIARRAAENGNLLGEGTDYSLPNALVRTRTAAAAWRLACAAGRVRATLAARVSLLDLSEAGGPGRRPTVFVVDARTAFETAAGLLALRRLHVRPRLVVAAQHFDGPARRALDAVGALPAIPGSSATRNAAAAAVRAGESVAFGLGGLDDAQDADATAVADATSAPLVRLAVSAAPAQPRRPRRRARVLVTAGDGAQPRMEAVA